MRYFDSQQSLGNSPGNIKPQPVGDIFQQLQGLGFKYQSHAIQQVDEDIPDDELIEAYREVVDNIMDEDGYRHIEVIHLQNYSRITGAYVYKSVSDKLETRLITHGKCSLFIKLDDQVLEFECRQGDVIRVPGNLNYWVEVGMHACRYIHLYMSEEAWDKPTDRQDLTSGGFYTSQVEKI